MKDDKEDLIIMSNEFLFALFLFFLLQLGV